MALQILISYCILKLPKVTRLQREFAQAEQLVIEV